MQIETFDRPAIPIIGKLGCGPASCAKQWIPALWQSANGNFEQVRPMVLWNELGAIRSLWGAMSDVRGRFLPWGESGMYLAGFEVHPDAAPPEDWVRWDLPAARYVAATTAAMEYDDTYRHMLHTYLPEQGLRLAGAVQEHYPQAGNAELVELLFPIEAG